MTGRLVIVFTAAPLTVRDDPREVCQWSG